MRSPSCAPATAARSLARAAAAAVLLAACGDSGGPGLPAGRVDYVDGAVEPILVDGATVVIEGFGFGAAPGEVRVPTTTGDAAATVVSWSDFAIQVAVPAGVAPGTLTVIAAGGRRFTAAVRALPSVPFAPAALTWQARPPFPQAPIGVALAAAEFPASPGGAAHRVTLYAAGGAEPVGGDSLLAPDSGVYIAPAAAGGGAGAWTRHAVLPARRALAAAAVATPHNSRTPAPVLYVIGGIDAAGRPQATVYAADVTADTVRALVPVEPLPGPTAGAIAVVRRGRLYVMGGTDSLGRPQRSVYVGRVRADGRIDGWYAQPALPAPRAYGGGAIRAGRVAAFGGLADSTGPGGELDPLPARLATSDTAPLSTTSGFFTGAWAPGPALLPEGRSQFATLDLGNVVLVVGGMYSGAAGNAAEALAAAVVGDSLGPFAGPVGANSIAGAGGGTLIGPAGAAWRDADGTRHGLVLGGFDLATRLRRTGVWSF